MCSHASKEPGHALHPRTAVCPAKPRSRSDRQYGHPGNLAGNVLTAATLESMGEVFALARNAGIDLRLAFDVSTGSLFDGRMHKKYGGKIVDWHYMTGAGGHGDGGHR
jgi:hypothetical protein